METEEEKEGTGITLDNQEGRFGRDLHSRTRVVILEKRRVEARDAVADWVPQT